MSLKPCKFTVGGKEMNYDEFRGYLLDNYDELVGGGVPPKSRREEEDGDDGETRKKSVLSRAFEGTAPERVKRAIESLGLSYKVVHHKDAEAAAEAFLKRVGLKSAVEALRNKEIAESAAAFLWVKAIDEVGMMMQEDLTKEERDQLQELERELIDELDVQSRGSGRFISALGEAYRSSSLGYKLSTKIKQYEEITGDKIPDEVKQRFEEYDRKLREAESRVKEAEEKVRIAEEKAAIENIVEDVSRQIAKKAPSSKEVATRLAAKVRGVKINKPNVFNASNPGVVIWDGAVELVASTIEAGGSLIEAVKKGVDYIKKSDWYSNLSSDQQKEAVDGFKQSMGDVVPSIEVTDGKVKIPTAIIRQLVESGVTNMDDLAATIKEQIKDTYPDVELRDIRDAITGYGRQVNPTRSDLEKQISEMKQVGRLQSKIEDLEKGIVKKNPREKAKVSEEIQRLRDEVKRLMPESVRTENAKERARQRIAELQERIKNKDFAKKEAKPIIEDAELTKLRAEAQRVKDQFDEELYKAELESRTVKQKVGDVAIEVWNLTRALMATLELSFILVQGGIQTIAHPKNAARALLKSMQHMMSEKRAKEWGEFIKVQPYYDQMRKSKLALSEFDAKLNAREEQFLGGWVNNIWDLIGWPVKKVGEMTGSAGMQKAYDVWTKINPIKAVERAGVGYLNTLRVLRYLDGMEVLKRDGKTFEDNPKDFRNMADAINTLTGRASLGKIDESRFMKKALSTMFFSPRNWASILKTSTPLALAHFGSMGYKDGSYKPSAAQKMALGDFMKFVGVTGSLVALAAAYYNNDDDEETDVELDPRSSDFLKIRIGNTRIDPWGGRIQQITFQTRMIMGALGNDAYRSTTNRNLTRLGEGMTPTMWELAGRMAKSKLNPSASLIVDFFKSKQVGEKRVNDFGEQYEFSEELKQSLYPMYWGTVNELYKEQPDTVAAFLAAAAFFGVGASTYGAITEEKVAKEFDRLANKMEEKEGRILTPEENRKLVQEAYDNLKEKERINKVKRKMTDNARALMESEWFKDIVEKVQKKSKVTIPIESKIEFAMDLDKKGKTVDEKVDSESRETKKLVEEFMESMGK